MKSTDCVIIACAIIMAIVAIGGIVQRSHGGLRLTKSPVPGGRRASSVDLYAMLTVLGICSAVIGHFEKRSRGTHRVLNSRHQSPPAPTGNGSTLSPATRL